MNNHLEYKYDGYDYDDNEDITTPINFSVSVFDSILVNMPYLNNNSQYRMTQQYEYDIIQENEEIEENETIQNNNIIEENFRYSEVDINEGYDNESHDREIDDYMSEADSIS